MKRIKNSASSSPIFFFLKKNVQKQNITEKHQKHAMGKRGKI
jgi:hypothetical protein